jgi:hypothetical protein
VPSSSSSVTRQTSGTGSGKAPQPRQYRASLAESDQAVRRRGFRPAAGGCDRAPRRRYEAGVVTVDRHWGRSGALVDVMFSEHRDMTAAVAFFQSVKIVTDVTPDRVTTDIAAAPALNTGACTNAIGNRTILLTLGSKYAGFHLHLGNRP